MDFDNRHKVASGAHPSRPSCCGNGISTEQIENVAWYTTILATIAGAVAASAAFVSCGYSELVAAELAKATAVYTQTHIAATGAGVSAYQAAGAVGSAAVCHHTCCAITLCAAGGLCCCLACTGCRECMDHLAR